jgi:hypothetical protein
MATTQRGFGGTPGRTAAKPRSSQLGILAAHLKGSAPRFSFQQLGQGRLTDASRCQAVRKNSLRPAINDTEDQTDGREANSCQTMRPHALAALNKMQARRCVVCRNTSGTRSGSFGVLVVDVVDAFERGGRITR